MYTEQIEKALGALREDIDGLTGLPGSRKFASELSDLKQDFNALLDALDDAEQSQAEAARDVFDLRYRRLAGISEEMTALARKRPESPCNVFKLRQVNGILQPLKDELEAYQGDSLPLADEDAALSYSDVSLLVRSYLDLSAVYAARRYSLRYYDNKKR